MTESKWLACDDPKRMLTFLRSKVNDRKLKLCWCECCRVNRQEPSAEATDRAVEIGERCADGGLAEAEEIVEADAALQKAMELTEPGGDTSARLNSSRQMRK